MNDNITIQLSGVTVDFPIYSVDARSFKKSLLHRSTGGMINQDIGSRISIRALDNVDLLLEEGDRVGLIGHNGSGKTTLLRVLAGVYEPMIGRIMRRGKVTPLLDLALGVNLDSTGHENILSFGSLVGLTKSEIREHTEEIEAFTELGDYLSMPVRTYSTGMMLRLGFAVCTCVNPEILLMDEWISVGDASFMEKAEQRLRSFVDNAGILVLASHNQVLLEHVCNKGILLNQGKVKAVGPIRDVLDTYNLDGNPTN